MTDPDFADNDAVRDWIFETTYYMPSYDQAAELLALLRARWTSDEAIERAFRACYGGGGVSASERRTAVVALRAAMGSDP